MPSYRKKPVVIEAIQWSGNEEQIKEIMQFMNISECPVEYLIPGEPGNIVIDTLEGEMTAAPGWWIIKGIKNEFYPCKDDIFQASYERDYVDD
jgi:hypothetical protein